MESTLKVEMDVALELDIDPSSSLTSTVFVRKFVEGQCIFCYGTAKAACKSKDKLHVLTAEGLEAIQTKCVDLEEETLLSYLRTNPHLRHCVHNTCRTAFNRKRNNDTANVTFDAVAAPSKRTLRSDCQAFRWKEMCFLCEQPLDMKDSDSRKVATLSLEETLKKACALRGYDTWALQIQGLLEMCNDLPSVDAVYHKSCHSRFVNCRSKLQADVPCGRPVKHGAQAAFNRLCDALETSCVEKVYTLLQLHAEMVSLAGPGADVYEMTRLKEKLEERYGTDLFVGGQPGRPGVVCFRRFASHVLSDKWYADRDEEGMGKEETVIR
jgi:hypothetical protein